MAEGFKVADGFVAVFADVDRRVVSSSASDAADEAGRVLGDGITRESSRSLRRNRGSFVTAGSVVGTEMGGGLLKSVGGMGASLGTAFSALGPYAIGAAAAVGVAMAPALMAGLAGGITAGAGLGVIGLGAFLLKEEPEVKAAAKRLTDGIGSTFKEAAMPMMQPLIDGMDKFTEIMTGDNIFPALKQMFTSVGAAIVPLAEGLGVMVEKSMPGLVKLVEASVPMLTQMAPAFGKIGEGISIFAEQIALAGPDATVFFTDLITWIGGFIAGMGYFIGWVARGYGELRNFFTSIPGWISATVQWFTNLWTNITGFFTSIRDGFTNASNTVVGWVNTVSTFIGSAVAFFASLPGRIGAAISAIPGIVGSILSTVASNALFTVGYMIGAVVGFFATLPGKVGSAVIGLWGAMVGAFRTAQTNSISTATSMVSSVVNFFATLPGRSASAVAGLWGSMVGAFNSARSGASSLATSIVQGAISILTSLPGRAGSAVSGLHGAIMGAAAGAGSWLVGAGRSIIQGLISGITSMIGAAAAAARNAVGSVVAGAKAGLGISSPSKVFRDEVGKFLLPGLTEGMRRTLPRTRRDVAAVTRAVAPTIGGVGSGGGSPSSSSNQYTFAPGSIVLDASKMTSIQDVIALIGGIRSSARAQYARTATTPGM